MFEFDPAKSLANKAKHGIDFDEAQALWQDTDLVMLPSRYPSEPRFLAVAALDGKFWTAIVALRGQDVRLISVRRARKEEADVYRAAQRRRD